MSVIEIRGLTKDYGNNKGVFDLDFSIEEGDVFGYLGPNGAGKTTTIRHLMGFLNPDKGYTKVLGLDARTEAKKIQKRVGYLPGEIAFLENMTGLEFLKFMARMREMKDLSNMNNLIQRLELDPKGRIRKMSKGMKQKVGLVCALMDDPEVLILDEPTSGLDPLMQNVFVEIVHEEKRKGKTILMSSHSFEEVGRTCNRVGIIKDGRMVAIEDIRTLQEAKSKVYHITFYNEEELNSFKGSCKELIGTNNSTAIVKITGNVDSLLKELAKYRIRDIESAHQSIEELFLHYYGGEKVD